MSEDETYMTGQAVLPHTIVENLSGNRGTGYSRKMASRDRRKTIAFFLVRDLRSIFLHAKE